MARAGRMPSDRQCPFQRGRQVERKYDVAPHTARDGAIGMYAMYHWRSIFLQSSFIYVVMKQSKDSQCA